MDNQELSELEGYGYQLPASQGQTSWDSSPAHPTWWSTDWFAAVLGGVIWIFLFKLYEAGLFGGTLGKIFFALLGASYAHDCYPSYFTAAPALDNARLVSLLNTLLGGPVFGCIWNLNLTKRTQGVSHLVCILLNGFSIMSNVALLSACMPFREQTGLA